MSESTPEPSPSGTAVQRAERDELDAQTPLAGEQVDHDGVMEMADTDDERVNDAMYDTGWSPPERERHVGRVGLTPSEAGLGESLDDRLAQEEPETPAGSGGAVGAGSPELPADADVDGELLDDEVGTLRAGRLVEPDQGGGPDTEASSLASDVGVDGGAASAEEAAVHVVPDAVDDRDPEAL